MNVIQLIFSDVDIDLKACIACLSFIITSAVRFNCNSSALHSELQQLGLPREHSTSVKRVVDDYCEELTSHFNKQSLKGKNYNFLVIKSKIFYFQLIS